MSADNPKVPLDNIPLDQGQALPHEISVPPQQIHETQAPNMILNRELPNESPPPYQPPPPYQSPPPYQPSYPCQLPFQPSQNQFPPSQQNQVPQQPIQVTVPPTIDSDHSIGMYCPYCKTNINTIVRRRPGALPWIIFGVFCFLGLFIGILWFLCWIPFCMDSCMDIEHTCPSCNRCVRRISRM